MYTKPVYGTSLHKTSLLVNNERNVHGQNMTKVKAVQNMCKMCAKYVQTVYKLCNNYVQTLFKLCANCEQAVCKLVGRSLNKLKVDIEKMKGEIQFLGQTHRHTHFLLPLGKPSLK